MERGRSDECEAPLREGLALRESALDPEHVMVHQAKGWLGLCLLEPGGGGASDPARRNEGLALLEGSLSIVEARFGGDYELVRRIRQTLD
ncbi:MAG: hypothetical protein ACODAA_02430 [Gemmatimonadota bacterium]